MTSNEMRETLLRLETDFSRVSNEFFTMKFDELPLSEVMRAVKQLIPYSPILRALEREVYRFHSQEVRSALNEEG